MSLLVIGISHHNADVESLELLSLDADGRAALLDALCGRENVAEAIVVSTCNRTEVYAEALTFHGAVAEVSELLLQHAGNEAADLAEHLYLHFEDRAIAHAFRVASGLDSMALGESEIRAQLRTALREAQESRHVGPALNTLFQNALRVGKRVHTDTAIGSVSGSLVDAGLRLAGDVVGVVPSARVLVVGAGAMASLAATAAARGGAQVTVANRTLARGQALADRIGARAVRLSALDAALAEADIVIACAGSQSVLIGAAQVEAAMGERGGRPQAYVDLAMPHDISRSVAGVAGVSRFDLDDLRTLLHAAERLPAVQDAEDMVTAEVAAYLTVRAAEAAAPTIAQLRRRANDVLTAELGRLEGRTPGLDAGARHEIEVAMGRLVDKLLHAPTLRVKQAAANGTLAAYTAALGGLFDLDPYVLTSVESPAELPVDRVTESAQLTEDVAVERS
jgi:glutamyl-tRNA reductase